VYAHGCGQVQWPMGSWGRRLVLRAGCQASCKCCLAAASMNMLPECSTGCLLYRNAECLLLCWFDVMAAHGMEQPDYRWDACITALLPAMLQSPQDADLALLSCRGAARGGPPAVNMRLLAMLLDIAQSNHYPEHYGVSSLACGGCQANAAHLDAWLCSLALRVCSSGHRLISFCR